jgi:hypothetical protein
VRCGEKADVEARKSVPNQRRNTELLTER